MSYRTILVCLNDIDEAKRLLPVAAMLASQFEAHLIGLYSVQNMEIYASVSLQLSSSAIAEMQKIQDDRASEVKALFDSMAAKESFVSEWRQIAASTASTGEKLAEQARSADLVLMSQVDPADTHPGPATIQRHVIEHSGRPVLVIPRFGDFSQIGRRPLIGWSGTGECSRAVHDALPFLQSSDETRVFWVNNGDSATDQKLENTGHDIAKSLSRHSVNATVSHRSKSNITIGDELLNEAADTDIDLIVTGAFGHSRLYDFVIGATTTHLLKTMTTPVLFAS